MIFKRRGMGALPSFTRTGCSTEGPSSITSGGVMVRRVHGVAAIDLIESAHHLSAMGLRNTALALMTLPSAVATL